MPTDAKAGAVLVTGGAKRVGAGIVRALAAQGRPVFLHYHRSKREAEALAAEIAGRGGSCWPVAADLSRSAEAIELVPHCLAAGVPLAALVNNASHFEHDAVASLTPESWQRHLGLNLAAPAFLAKAFAAQATDERDYVVINVLDQKVRNLNPDYFSYTVSKLGLLGLTETLALALAPKIRVCGVAPGITLPSGSQTDEQYRQAAAATPLGRSSTVAEIAGAVLFLLATRSMTGNVLYLDGGESLKRRPRDVAFEIE